jgi:hypothetical protein
MLDLFPLSCEVPLRASRPILLHRVASHYLSDLLCVCQISLYKGHRPVYRCRDLYLGSLLCCVGSLLASTWSVEIPVGFINLLSTFLSCGFCCLLVEGLLTCPVLIHVLYHCSVEGFSVGGIIVKPMVLLLFLWGSLYMSKLSHSPH